MNTILLVDDDEQNLYFLKVLFKGNGFGVITASDGAKALKLARQYLPILVISDLLMPVMDGFSLLRHWKADPALCNTPFVVYSATYVEPSDERLVRDLGADAFIVKPLEPDLLLARIREVLDQSSQGDHKVSARPNADEPARLREYNEVLIRKLEEKALQLEAANHELERDVARRKTVEAALRDSEQQLRELSRRVIDTEESERRKINRELHDRVGQSLSALQLNINLIRAALAPHVLEPVDARLADTQKLLNETTQNVRDVMADLHPPALENYGLWPALRTYCDTFAVRTGVQVVLQSDAPRVRLQPAVELALFRVVQEALANAAKHARARKVELGVVVADGRFRLEVRDDGVGFDPAAVMGDRPHWGLAIMAERVQAVGASLQLKSAPGQGTVVVVDVAMEART